VAHDAIAEAAQGAVEASEEAVRAIERDIASFVSAAALARSRVGFPSGEPDVENEFARTVDTLLGDIDDVFLRRRQALKSFNIALFGRTGAGKSSLIEAMTAGDGSSVSLGESDWTTDVRPVSWRSCLLFDTPGINGWGRNHERSELEARARRCVEVADLVLICFDSQSQQASEFAKLADWVRDFKKPAIAVLNVRNPRWRVPPRTAIGSARASLSVAVRQHHTNIQDELTRVGLPNVPVVALSSRRALIARAAEPYHGPDEQSVRDQRAAYGVARLLEWSNYPRLEGLVVASIRSHAVALRIEGLRAQLAGSLERAAGALEAIAKSAESAAQTLEASALGPMIELLGYPEVSDQPRRASLIDEHGTELLAELEALRGSRFQAATDGSFARFVRQLATATLLPHRTRSLARAEELVLAAFDEGRSLSGGDIERAAFDQGALAATVEKLTQEASEFLRRSTAVAFRDANVDLRYQFGGVDSLRGDAGHGWKTGAYTLRGAGLLAGIANIAGLVALANGWNPGGWVAFGVSVGLGLLSGLLGWLGGKARDNAERERLRARSAALGQVRQAVRDVYDRLETSLIDQSRTLADEVLGTLLRPALARVVALRRIQHDATRIASSAHRLAAGSGVQRSPQEAIAETLRGLTHAVHASTPAGFRAYWLGEDWIRDPNGLAREAEDAAPVETHAYDPPLFEWMYSRMKAFFAGLTDDVTVPSADAWLAVTQTSASVDASFGADVARLKAIRERGQARLLVAGDYNAGKSSFIKRLLVDAGCPVPPSLEVRALPATATATEYEWDGLILVDTPGLQSTRSEHEEAALSAVPESSAVAYLFQPNLLLGDTSGLVTVMRGSAERGILPKSDRSFVLINRSDELGSDPEESPEEFERLAARKRAELRQALWSRGVDLDEGRIMCVASDPYGLVGARLDVNSHAYDSFRRWDGMDAFALAYRSVKDDLARGGCARSVLEGGVAATTRAMTRANLEAASADGRVSALARIEGTLAEASLEATRLEGMLQAQLVSVVESHAFGLRDEVLVESDSQRALALRKRLESWWSDEALVTELEAWARGGMAACEHWRARASERLERSLAAAEVRAAFRFELDSSGLPDASPDEKSVFRRVFDSLTAGLKGVNRDVVYGIGKALGFRFRPWGAVRLAQQLAKVGAALAVVGVVLDVREIWKQEDRLKRAEEERRQLDQFVRESVSAVVREVAEQQGEGLLPILRKMREGVEDERVRFAELRSTCASQGELARSRAAGLRELRVDALRRLGRGDDPWQ
jgi:predicted GTPase